MARARNIKPGLFKNEILGVADPLYTLLFEGLWLLADREGRLEDRPLRIKAEVFPYREGLDVDVMLNWLQANGFVRRYAVGAVRYIAVLEFVRHQNPHKNEPESVIPAPDANGSCTEEIGSARADSLIPDSGLLIPEKEPTVLVGKPAASRPAACPTERLIALYHEHLPMLPRVEVFNDSRRRALSARWRQVITDHDIAKALDPREAALEWFAWYFQRCASSRFLTGKAKDWRADFDFLMLPTKFAKVVEGHYHKERA